MSNDTLFSNERWSELAKVLGFSARQGQVARCLTLGMSDRQIATELELSEHTVRTHLSRIYQKLNVQDRMELVLLVFRQFLRSCRAGGCSQN